MMKVEEEEDVKAHQTVSTNNTIEVVGGPQTMKLPRISSLSHLLELDYFGSIPQLLRDNLYDDQSNYIMNNVSNTNHGEKFQLGDQVSSQQQNTNNITSNNCNIFFNYQQPLFVNPTFQFQ